MANIKREQDLTSSDDFQPVVMSFDSTGFQHLFGRNSSSAMPALGSGSHTYEPAFIETDFTTPLTVLDRSRHVTSAPPSSFPAHNPQVPRTFRQVSSVLTPADRQYFVPSLNKFQQNCYVAPNANSSNAVQSSVLQKQNLLAMNPPSYTGRRDKQFVWPSRNLVDESGRNPRQGTVARDLAFHQTDAVSLLRDASVQKLIQPSRSELKQMVVIGPCQGSAGMQLCQPTALAGGRTLNSGTHFQNILPKPSPQVVVTQAVASIEVGKQFASSQLHESVNLVPSTRVSAVKLEAGMPSKSSHTPLSVPVVSGSGAQFIEQNSFRVSSEPLNIDSFTRADVQTEHLQDSGLVLDCSKKSFSNDAVMAITETPLTLSRNSVSCSINSAFKFDNVLLERPSSRASGSSGECGDGMISDRSAQLKGLSMDAVSESVASKSNSSVLGDKPREDYEGHRLHLERCYSMEGNSVRSCMSALSLTAEGEFEEERAFIWDDYLEDTKSVAASATSFKHVECSIQSGFEKGMKLEVANKNPEGSFWIGSILMTCGQLLRMRPEGCGDDALADFWCDILSREVHQLGWCCENGRVLCPSEELRWKYPTTNWETVLENSLKDAKTPPFYMLDKGTGPLPINQIQTGMFLEVQLDLQPDCVWPVKIVENVGGRLLLRYEAVETAADDFWLFYLHPRVHLVGWGKANGCLYKLPEVVTSKRADFDWFGHLEQNFESFQKNQPPSEIFEDQVKIQKHSFVEGWMLEAVHPGTLSTIHPATVKRIINEFFFTIELILDELEPVQFCCHSNSANIFPIGWCSANNVELCGTDFDWTKYLSEHSAEPAPKELFNTTTDLESLGFEAGMKLEAVNPGQPGQICVATITRVANCVMWLHLDHNPPSVPDHIVALDTFDVFPIGWCESNECPLKTPKLTATRRLATVQAVRYLEDEVRRNELYMQMKEADLKKSSGWCPKIYFNYRCFTGRYLSKGRLVLLPRSVGPGPVVLVMTTVLTKLIKVAYKSSRVLRELQLKGKPNPNMKQQILKAKYKGKSYSATVEICDSSDQITDFCRNVCRRLECCPNLISPNSYDTVCPENCLRLAKGKYPYNFGQKKRKIGRPPGGHSNLEFGAKKPGKRRKHKKLLLTLRKKHGLVGRVSSPGDDEELESNSTGSWKCLMENDDESRDSRESVMRVSQKRKEPCMTDMQMRGLKLPRYSFDRRTHKKVLHATQVSNDKEKMTRVTMQVPKSEEVLQLASNPLYWTVQEVVEYIKTTDCASIARLFKEQEIDGQSLLLLSLPTVQEHLEPKLGPAVKLCHQIERLKVTFYQQFAS